MVAPAFAPAIVPDENQPGPSLEYYCSSSPVARIPTGRSLHEQDDRPIGAALLP
jgi:hypothetical protein